ncbi:MAG: hypothetical protein JO027_01865 [Solirubrobacterales bacterium]|nr:hypothetical protein [Solirubrobacterales bacterium]
MLFVGPGAQATSACQRPDDVIADLVARAFGIRRRQQSSSAALVASHGPAQGNVGALALHAIVAAGVDRVGGEAIKVLAAVIVDVVVVGAQDRADHRAHRHRAVAEALSGQHRGELEHAHHPARARVATRPQAYVLM